MSTARGAERIGIVVWELGEGAVATPARPTQAVRFSDVDVWQFHWANDEQLVFNLIDTSEGSGRQDFPGLYVVRYDGEGLRELVTHRFAFVRAMNIQGRYALTPNHTLLAVPQMGGTEVVVGEWRSVPGGRPVVRPLWLSLASGRTRDASGGGPSGASAWLFDTRGEARLAITFDAGRRQLHWRAPGQEAWRVLESSEAGGVRFNPAFVTDDGALYVTRLEGAARRRVLARFDFATGRPEPEPLVRVAGFDYVGTPVHGRPGSALLGLHLEADSGTSVWFDAGMQRLQKEAEDRFAGQVVHLSCRRCEQDDRVVLAWAHSDQNPGHLWLYRGGAAGDAAGGPTSSTGTAVPGWMPIGRARAGVDPERMGRVSLTRIAARDGRELPVWVTLPATYQAGKPGPAVVLVHGGPWIRGGHWRWSAMEQFLASRGYVVISPDFRGSAGYGLAHLDAGNKQWGQAMQDDVADAARWARTQGLADRFCIAGASYGGYSALMGLVRDPDLYRCGVAWVAVTDPFLLLEGSWWVDDDQSEESRRTVLPRRIGDAQKDVDMLRAASPVVQAARVRAPLLLAYGGADRRVPLEHGNRLRSAMQAASLEPQWVVYGGEAHSWLKTATHVDFAQRMETFLARHLLPVTP